MEPVSKEVVKDYWRSANPEVVFSLLEGEKQVPEPETQEVRRYLKKLRKHSKEFLYYKSIVEQLCEKYKTTPDNLLSMKDKGSEKRESKHRLEDRISALENQVQALSLSPSRNEPIKMQSGENQELLKVFSSFLEKSDQDNETQKLLQQLKSAS